MLRLDNVSFYYKPGNYIIENLSYCFEPNSFNVICGENGSGKTTLTRLILGLLKPVSGTIERDPQMAVGYLPDFDGLYGNCTILENIKFRIGLYGLSYSNLKAKVFSWLYAYNLEESKDMLVRELSMGMKKKVALICACITSPDILILDEPTNSLDLDAKQELTKMLKDITAGKTLTICISHDADFIQAMEVRPIYLINGAIQHENH